MDIIAVFSSDWFRELVYLIAVVFFIFGLKMLSSPRTARKGNYFSAFGMFIAIVITLAQKDIVGYQIIIAANVIGIVVGFTMAQKVPMTAMPEMVAVFNGFGGIASALVATAEYFERTGQIPEYSGGMAGTFNGSPVEYVTMSLSILVGMVTFTGSFIAFAKLAEVISGKPVRFFMQHIINLIIFIMIILMAVLLYMEPGNKMYFYLLLSLSFVLGITLTIPIGGADMPVVVSLLNSYSGIAVAMTGFVLSNNALVIVGSLVGASGIILTLIMCRAMNRSLVNVIFGGFGGEPTTMAGTSEHMGTIKNIGPEEAGMLLDMAESVIFVPGYGMAVSQAQHAVKELSNLLEKRGVDVKFAIHPVAGRMPGHMNVLLAEAGIEYDKLYDMDINSHFSHTDISIVIGANDVVNPAAKTNPGSPIYGMPVLNVDESRHVLVLKRSMNPGFSGIENELFYKENTTMVFGDAKKTLEAFIQALEELGE